MYLLSAIGHTNSINMVAVLKYLQSGWTDKTCKQNCKSEGFKISVKSRMETFSIEIQREKGLVRDAHEAWHILKEGK